jgi:cell division protein FtsB
MDHKSTGIEYDREMFVPSGQQTTSAGPSVMGILLFVLGVAGVAALAFIGYRVMTQGGGAVSATDNRALLQVQQHLSQIDDRLDQLEQENHRLAAAQSLANSKKPAEVAQNDATSSAPGRMVYRVSPSISQQPRVVVVTPADSANTQKLAALQKDLGAAQDDASANREAWQATTDRLADVAGQIGSQHGEILHSQDQLNQLLAQTARSAVSFEIRRGSSPEQLGPVTVALKSTNEKNQRYTLCVYIQKSCVELKDRTLYEVVQVALSRNAPPLQVIATKIRRDGITGYLEVPHDAAAGR